MYLCYTELFERGLFCMLNWIVWNRTVFDIETVLILNLIVWNRTVFDIETVLILNLIVWNRTGYMNKNGFGIK